MTFTEATKNKIKTLHRAAENMAVAGRNAGVDSRYLEMIVNPYRNKAAEIAEKDLPLSRLFDESDIAFHATGNVDLANVKSNVIEKFIHATGGMMKAVASSLNGTGPRKDYEYTTMFAPGSIWIGLSVPTPDNLLGNEDPVKKNMDMAIELIESACSDIESDDFKKFIEEVPDKRKRNAILKAVKGLIPQKDGDIREITVYGPNRNSRLTSDKRRTIIDFIKKNVGYDSATVSGIVREIDLDRRSVKIRNIEKPSVEDSEIIAVYDESLDPEARNWLDKKLVFYGQGKTVDGKLRQVQIEFAEEPE
jgi:DNA-directed RNA polymerase subunit F